MADDNQNKELMQPVEYTDDNIRHLSDMEHVRTRPGMYIGRLGDGSLPEDGIYVLLKEVIDNSIDEFKMNAGKRIEVSIDENLRVSVRDYGRGIPQGKLVEAVSMLNTGGKYDSKAFKKSVGLNGVGVKAVNALSSHFEVKSYREGKVRHLVFEKGELKSDTTADTEDETGTYIFFEPDNTLFKNYLFHSEIVETMLRNYTYLNSGLVIMHNGRRILSRNGLKDLLQDTMTTDGLYPIVHMRGEDIEIAFTHTNQYGEEYHSFVNGQHTTQGGTHQTAFKEHIARTIKEFFGKYEYSDIRNGLVAAIAINVEEPVFESQTKIKLGSTLMAPEGETINKYVGDFIKQQVDNYLHIHSEVAEAIESKVKESERERKAMAGVTKLARERAKKANLHNRKLRDCRIHYSDAKNARKEESSIFITEGDSASGSITKSRDVNTQAVFSLRGKPLNSFGLTKKVVYENEEFNLLQAALDIEDGLDSLRYNKVIVATDADVDGTLPRAQPPHQDTRQEGDCRGRRAPHAAGAQERLRYTLLLQRRGAPESHQSSRPRPGDNALQRTRRDFARGVCPLHRPRHEARTSDPAQDRPGAEAARILHGKEHGRTPELHNKQLSNRRRPARDSGRGLTARCIFFVFLPHDEHSQILKDTSAEPSGSPAVACHRHGTAAIPLRRQPTAQAADGRNSHQQVLRRQR